MKINETTWIILFISIFIGLIIMIVTFIVTIIKINKIKKKAIAQEARLGNLNKAIKRKNAGELLWDLRDKSINPLEDVQMEFLINTTIRNEYKTFNIINSKSTYEEISLIKISKLKKTNANPDFTIIFPNYFNETFKKIYEELKKGQMIVIVNAKKNDYKKQIVNYLKTSKIKHDIINLGKGLILIVK